MEETTLQENPPKVKYNRDGETYEGRICKRGHDSGNGTSIRNSNSGDCVQCKKLRMDAWLEENAAKYKVYQKQYHDKLRLENPAKCQEYFDTQVARGHRKAPGNIKYNKSKNKVSQPELIIITQ